MTEQHQFQAEVGRLLDIVANALYSNKDVFLRELISNSSDACDRLRYAAITDEKLAKDIVSDYAIRLVIDTEPRTLTVIDNGIGMTHDDLINNLGTIAHSGTSKLIEEMGKSENNDAIDLIGKFGVGFYAAFMVADKIEVLTRKAGDKKAWLWISDGKGAYTIEEATKNECGTEITLHIKEDASDYLLEDKLKQVVKTYSDHIDFPVYFGKEVDGSAESLNSASALWTRSKKDIKEEEYNEFYHHVSGGMDMDKPWLTLHWRAEGAIEYSNLIFIPTMKPFDLYDPKREHGVKLYVKRVYITDGVEGLIPPFLRFLKGVVDSQDLPLNISREVLQNNPVVNKISSAITKRILEELRKKAEKDPEEFAEFWDLFGAVIKEGLYDAHQYREALNKVVRFKSSNSDKLVSLDEYIERMPEGQQHIYYISGSDLESLQNSPQLEGYKAKNIEVLFMTDTIDEFWLPVAYDYKQKSFKSVTKGTAEELNKVVSDNKDKKKAQTSQEIDDTAKNMACLITKLKEIIGDQVKDVCISQRLVDSPVCLIAQDSGIDIHMERILKKNQGYEDLSKRVLEINAEHPVIIKLQTLIANNSSPKTIEDTAWLLLDQARIIEGDPLPNPTEFTKRMARLMENSLL